MQEIELYSQTIDCTFYEREPITKVMSFFERALVGKQIDSVYVDSEITYIMLNDGTHITIRGWVVIEPGTPSAVLQTSEAAATQR